jgi:hypothetical protein
MKTKKTPFTLEELKDIFSYNEETPCDTHDLINCHCQEVPSLFLSFFLSLIFPPSFSCSQQEKTKTKRLKQKSVKANQLSSEQLSGWVHCFDSSNCEVGRLHFPLSLLTKRTSASFPPSIKDPIVQKLFDESLASFCFYKIVTSKEDEDEEGTEASEEPPSTAQKTAMQVEQEDKGLDAELDQLLDDVI